METKRIDPKDKDWKRSGEVTSRNRDRRRGGQQEGNIAKIFDGSIQRTEIQRGPRRWRITGKIHKATKAKRRGGGRRGGGRRGGG